MGSFSLPEFSGTPIRGGRPIFTASNFIRYAIVDIQAVVSSQNVNSVQVSEWNFLENGVRLTHASLMNYNGTLLGNSSANSNSDSPAAEQPQNANDNDVGTKWLDFRKEAGGLWWDFGTLVYPDTYRYYTANDTAGRDPTAWDIYFSQDNVNWQLVSSVTGFAPPATRQVLAGTWSLTY